MTKPTDLQTENESLRARVAELERLTTSWFSYDAEGDGFELHDSAKEARACAQRAMDYYAGNADEGWHEMSDRVCWGQVFQQVSVENTREATEDDDVPVWITHIEDRVLRDVESLESQLTHLRREIEAMRDELNEYKWHDVNELYPPTNKDVEICWRHSNGVTGKNVGHMNAFNQWWVKDTWVDGITHWRYIIDPRSTAKGGE